MSTKFETIYELNNSVYYDCSPIILCSQELLREAESGELYARLKFRNITYKIVIKVTVDIIIKDENGNPIGDPLEYSFDELSAIRDQYFGDKDLLSIPDPEAKSFYVVFKELVTRDNLKWIPRNGSYGVIPNQLMLSEVLRDENLAAQYMIDTGVSFFFAPFKYKDLWQCNCHAFNFLSEPECHNCKKTQENIFKHFNYDYLVKRRRLRIMEQQSNSF